MIARQTIATWAGEHGVGVHYARRFKALVSDDLAVARRHADAGDWLGTYAALVNAHLHHHEAGVPNLQYGPTEQAIKDYAVRVLQLPNPAHVDPRACVIVAGRVAETWDRFAGMPLPHPGEYQHVRPAAEPEQAAETPSRAPQPMELGRPDAWFNRVDTEPWAEKLAAAGWSPVGREGPDESYAWRAPGEPNVAYSASRFDDSLTVWSPKVAAAFGVMWGDPLSRFDWEVATRFGGDRSAALRAVGADMKAEHSAELAREMSPGAVRRRVQ